MRYSLSSDYTKKWLFDLTSTCKLIILNAMLLSLKIRTKTTFSPYCGIIGIDEKVDTKIKTFGIFTLLLPYAYNLTPYGLFNLYGRRDPAEEYFTNIKNEINQKGLHIHSQEALTGLLFIDFTALIFYFYMIITFKER